MIGALVTDLLADSVVLLGGGRVLVYVNPTTPGVDLPVHLMTEKFGALNLSYAFRGRRLDFLETELVAELGFDGVPHTCRIPWGALFFMSEAPEAMVVTGNQHTIIFTNSIPEGMPEGFPRRDVLEAEGMLALVIERPWAQAPSAPPKPARPKLGVIQGGKG